MSSLRIWHNYSSRKSVNCKWLIVNRRTVTVGFLFTVYHLLALPYLLFTSFFSPAQRGSISRASHPHSTEFLFAPHTAQIPLQPSPQRTWSGTVSSSSSFTRSSILIDAPSTTER